MDYNNVSSIGLDYIQSILCEQFNINISTVATCLARKGPSFLNDIIHNTNLSYPTIRHALLTLIQQNIIKFIVDAKDATICQYYLDTYEVFHRLRYCRYIYYIYEKFGYYARSICTYILQIGRATIKQIIDGVLEMIRDFNDPLLLLENANADLPIELRLNSNQLDLNNDKIRDSIEKHIFILIEKQMIIQVRSSKQSNDFEDVPIQQPISKNDYQEDFALQIFNHYMLDKKENHNKVINITSPHTLKLEEKLIGMKDIQSKDSVNSTFNLFDNEFKEAENFMANRWADSRLVRLITQIILSDSYIDETSNTNHFVSLEKHSLNTIQQKLLELPTDNYKSAELFDTSVLLQLLDLLYQTDKVIVTSNEAGKTIIYFDWAQFHHILIERYLFNFISSRYGVKAGRIWNYLFELSLRNDINSIDSPSFFDDQQIADQVLLPPQSTRSILYILSQGGYVRMHQSDLSTGAPSVCLSKHTLVYSVSYSDAILKLENDLYNILLNLLIRKQFESKTLSTFILSLTEINQNIIHQRQAGEDFLEYYMLEIDNVLMLLKDT